MPVDNGLTARAGRAGACAGRSRRPGGSRGHGRARLAEIACDLLVPRRCTTDAVRMELSAWSVVVGVVFSGVGLMLLHSGRRNESPLNVFFGIAILVGAYVGGSAFVTTGIEVGLLAAWYVFGRIV